MAKEKWTVSKINVTLERLIQDHRDIPAKEWLKANGYTSLVNAIDSNGGMIKFRLELGIGKRRFVSRGGLILRSYAEVSLANFLWSRNITVYNGRKYPETYNHFSGRHSGWYDLEFDATIGIYKDERIIIEIWGNNETHGPLGTDLEPYVKKRNEKLAFNAGNPFFTSLEYRDCYHENRLIEIMAPYIGKPSATRFGKDEDKIVPPPLWCTADEVLGVCREICQKLNVQALPRITWFTHESGFADRSIFAWEPNSYSQLLHKIAFLGGIQKVRTMLDQSTYNRGQWDPTAVAKAVALFYTDYGKWPIGDIAKGKVITKIEEKERRQRSLLLCNLIKYYFDSYEEGYIAAKQFLHEDIQEPQQRKLPCGVTLRKNGKFQAVIVIDKKRRGLGAYTTVEAAQEAVKKAIVKRDAKYACV
jgi:hypothetical protein